MRTMKFAVGLLFAGLSIVGCTRDTEIIDPAPRPIGGKGGKAILEVTPTHHGEGIDSALVMIKYDAIKGPIIDGYDDTIALPGFDGKMTAKFDSLKWGDYYLNVVGYDNGFAISGTAPFSVIDSNERTYNATVEVTEVDGSNHK